MRSSSVFKSEVRLLSIPGFEPGSAFCNSNPYSKVRVAKDLLEGTSSPGLYWNLLKATPPLLYNPPSILSLLNVPLWTTTLSVVIKVLFLFPVVAVILLSLTEIEFESITVFPTTFPSLVLQIVISPGPCVILSAIALEPIIDNTPAINNNFLFI